MPLPAPHAVVSGRPRTAPHQRAEENKGLIWFILQRRFSFLLADADRLHDAYSAAYIALLRAAENFDPARGVKFGSYASDCIQGKILQSLTDGKKAQRLPTVSLDVPLSEDGGRLEEIVADPQAIAPEQSAVQKIAFAQLLRPLKEQQRAVVQALYEGGQDTVDVARALGISRQRVHQIHAQALEALRQDAQGKRRRQRALN